MECAREYARTGSSRQYSRRQVSRHKARYGVAEVVAPVFPAPVEVAAEEAPNAANDVHSPDDLNLNLVDAHPPEDVHSPDDVHSPVEDQQYGSQREDGMGAPAMLSLFTTQRSWNSFWIFVQSITLPVLVSVLCMSLALFFSLLFQSS